MTLTEEEKKAIAALKRVAAKWPESLWLFSASGSLHVMRYGKDGHPVMTGNQGHDPDSVAATINIPNDGGDW